MVPKVFQGLGAYHRMVAYAIHDYTELPYSDFTVNDLAKWHNLLVAFMSDENPP